MTPPGPGNAKAKLETFNVCRSDSFFRDIVSLGQPSFAAASFDALESDSRLHAQTMRITEMSNKNFMTFPLGLTNRQIEVTI